jgi:cytochrome P450
MSLTQTINDLITDGILACVFGLGNVRRRLAYYTNGTPRDTSIGQFTRLVGVGVFSRIFKLYRLAFAFFDEKNVGQDEKECYMNCQRFREFFRVLINERREEMKNPDFENKGDFMTILLTDDLFKDNDEIMIDECLTFLGAATQTTTMFISNALYFLT